MIPHWYSECRWYIFSLLKHGLLNPCHIQSYKERLIKKEAFVVSLQGSTGENVVIPVLSSVSKTSMQK